ncbi:MAG: PP2C family serine/threonine-protein phosphatase [Eubacteriales bacterium]
MITYAKISDVGSRSVNEDCVGVFEKDNSKLFVLCDGLGGHGGGEIASAIAVEATKEVFMENDLESDELFINCLQLAQDRLHEKQRERGLVNEYKTTITLLHVYQGIVRLAHVGDSRIYTFKKHKMITRTLDHSVPQLLASQGEIKEIDIRFHEDRNRLIRVLGGEEDTPRYTVSGGEVLHTDMRFLMCSDGFWELILEKDMCKLLKSCKTPEQWLQHMESIVKTNGAGKNMDNYSAIVIYT